MGTSKGYIAPTSPQWRNAKRGVTSYLTDPTENKKKQAISRYAKAIKMDDHSLALASTSFAGLMAFISSANAVGLNDALREIGREDLRDLDPKDALDELLSFYSNGGSTIDDSVVLDCMADSFDVLEIEELSQITQADLNLLLNELICQFAKRKFAQMFTKQANEKCTLIEANNRLSEVQEYIYYTLKEELNRTDAPPINPKNIGDMPVVKSIIDKAFSIMEQWYGE